MRTAAWKKRVGFDNIKTTADLKRERRQAGRLAKRDRAGGTQ